MTEELTMNSEMCNVEGKPVNRIQKYVSEYGVPFMYESSTPEDLCKDARTIVSSDAVYTDEELASIGEFTDIVVSFAKYFKHIADVLTDSATDMAVLVVEHAQNNIRTPATVSASVHAYIASKLEEIRNNIDVWTFDGGMPTVEDAYRDCSRIIDKYVCNDFESLTRAYFEINNLLSIEQDFLNMRIYRKMVSDSVDKFELKLARVNARITAFESIVSILREYIVGRENARSVAVENVRKKIGGN